MVVDAANHDIGRRQMPCHVFPITDIVVAVLVATVLLTSLTAVSFILHFHLSRRSHRLRDLNSLWSVRVLLILFSSLWALAEILRLPHLLGSAFFPSHQPPVYVLCRAYVLISHAFAEPCFFATLLFLLQASLDDTLKVTHPDAFASALTVALATSLPFFVLHAFLLTPIAAWLLAYVGLVPEDLGRVVGGIGEGNDSPTAIRCSYPLFSTVLLTCFGALYVPWFVSVCWRAVSVVINKKLRVRLYALAVSVVLALSVQVAAFALTTFWNPNDGVFQGLGLIAFLAVLTSAMVGQGVFVVRPIHDAMEVGSWCRGGCRSSGGVET